MVVEASYQCPWGMKLGSYREVSNGHRQNQLAEPNQAVESAASDICQGQLQNEPTDAQRWLLAI